MSTTATPMRRTRDAAAAVEAMRAMAAGPSPEAESLIRALLAAPGGRTARVERFLAMRRAACVWLVQEAMETVPAFWADLLSDPTGATIMRVIESAGLIACGEACRHGNERRAALMLALGADDVAASQRAAEGAAWPPRAGRVLASLTLDVGLALTESGLRGRDLVRNTGHGLLASAWHRLDDRISKSLAGGAMTNLPRLLEAAPVFKAGMPDDEWACLKRLLAGATAEATR